MKKVIQLPVIQGCGLRRLGPTIVQPNGMTETPVGCEKRGCRWNLYGRSVTIIDQVIIQDENGADVIRGNENPRVIAVATRRVDSSLTVSTADCERGDSPFGPQK